jgi:hypothetical protein
LAIFTLKNQKTDPTTFLALYLSCKSEVADYPPGNDGHNDNVRGVWAGADALGQ